MIEALSVPPTLLAQDVAVAYPGASRSRPAGANVTVRPGEVVLLMGPSGCGKSALALCVNGLVPRSLPAAVSGHLEVSGVPVARRDVARWATRVGMVFQDVDAQIVMDRVFDEVAFGPENLRRPVAEVTARSEDALRAVGLWERRDDDPGTLSGGQKQRLAVACAIAMDQELLVLDEPTANLDPVSAADLYDTLAGLARRDRAVLLVDHDVDGALTIADRVVVLDSEGRTTLDGPAAEVFGHHGDRVAALGLRLPAATRIGLFCRRVGRPVPVLPTTVPEVADLLSQAGPIREQSRLTADASAGSDDDPPAGPRAARVAIDMRGVTVRRDRRDVLRDITTTVREGEMVGVVGVSGSGKTTLLQAMAGLLRPVRGHVTAAGDPTRRPGRRGARGIGYVFQNPEHQFVAETVERELALALPPGPREDVRARLDDELVRYGLLEARDRHPFLLSGGQKRRLSVATALVGGARILLLDEPTFGQDQAYVDVLLDGLTALNRAGVTVVLVSHDLDLVAEYTDRTLVMADGRLCSAHTTAATFADETLLTEAGLVRPALDRVAAQAGAPPELVRRVRADRR